MSRGEELWAIMEAAVRNTLRRAPTLRGPYVIPDAELEDCIRLLEERKETAR
jgi:hypothetical protein